VAIIDLSPSANPSASPSASSAPTCPAATSPAEPGHPLDRLLADHNLGLASAGVSLRIERRGERLGLRGPLPRRRGSGDFAVQRISLGLPASEAGLGEAGRQLRQVLAELQRQQFDWQRWGAPAQPAPSGAALPAAKGGIEQQLNSFEQAFQRDPARRHNPAGSRTTWTAAYRPYLRRLAQAARDCNAQQPTARLLEQVLESYPAGSRSRQQCGTALGALADHLQLALPDDWRERAAGYGLHRAQFRQLPSDSQIEALLELIPNPAWRLAYGLMATYGLRNHEVFFCDLSALAPGADRVIRVLPTSKTGEHQVWPFQPEWVDRFELERLGRDPGLLPPVRTDLRHTTLQQAGRRVAEQFRRYGLPITPYDLRHAWAVRTIHIGLPDTVAARMMGHSVAIHTRTYHHWITRRDQQQAVDTALARVKADRQQAA
jgi:integrase